MSRHRRRGLPLLTILSLLGALLAVPVQQAQAQAFAVLVFAKTAGVRHDSIPAGIAAIRQLGQRSGFTVDATEDAAAFTDANLARYQAVVWLSTTGDVLNATQQAAFERYIRAGGGYVGVHAAAVKVEDHAGNVHVLASLDENTDQASAWCQNVDGGRGWYTGGGHTQESYSDPRFLARLLGGIRTAAGAQAANCGIPSAAPLSQNVHLFYYPWYGAANGAYRHWQQGGHTPPNDIGANLYPTAGPYDSGDFAGVVDQHMRWVRQTGAGVLVYSWWGQGSYEDGLAQGVLDAAARYGITVAWHLEPYGGRTAASTVADINYINQRYGGHPAFYRSADHGNKGAFYVFQSLFIPDADWAALDAVTGGSIVLAQTTNPTRIAHFSGMYTYDAIAGATAPGWETAGEYAAAHNLVWAPSVGPGYIDDRAVPGNTTPTLDRANGATYDLEWTNALDPTKGGIPTWVSVTSFNEWHEGSVIEPASSTPPAGFGYLTYEGAYGRTGTAAETAYLDRTAYWTGEFEQRRTENLALNRPATADSQCAATEGPEKAVNGSVSGGNSDKWCSLGATKWLKIDLGAQQQLGRFVLRHAAAGGETAAFNTKDYDLQTSVDGTTWTTVVTARGNTQDVTTHTISPISARYIRLNVLTPTQDTDRAARIYELEAYTN